MTSVKAYTFFQSKKVCQSCCANGSSLICCWPCFTHISIQYQREMAPLILLVPCQSILSNGTSYKQAWCAFFNHFNIHQNRPVPSAYAIKNCVENFKKPLSTTIKKPGKPKTIHTPKNIKLVRVVIEKKTTSLSSS